MGAEMAGARSDHDPLDRGPTLETWQLGSPVHHETIEVLPGPSIRKQIGQVVEAGSSVVYRRVENRANRGQEPLDLFDREVRSSSHGVDPGDVKRLICVDIAQPGYHHLVE